MQNYTVSQLNDLIANLFDKEFNFPLMVEGEISNFAESSNKHWYFTLKEEKVQIKAVMFRNSNQSLNIKPQNGDKVLVRANLSFYKDRGDCQLICSTMSPLGLGKILAQIEALKNKLSAEGLFDLEFKKQVPILPQKIGIVTSLQAAALQDILRVFREHRSPVEIYIFHSMVQGNEAAKDLANKIDQANNFRINNQTLDLIIVTRGGGSTEDLLAFSDELVIRAIFKAQVPIISAVGHEIDSPISDFVADIQTPTPTAAANLISNQIRNTIDKIYLIQENIKSKSFKKIQELRSYLNHFSIESFMPLLIRYGERLQLRLDTLNEAIIQQVTFKYANISQKFLALKDSLESTSPKVILEKGYALIYDKKTNKIIKDSKKLTHNKEISIVLHNGLKNAIIKE